MASCTIKGQVRNGNQKIMRLVSYKTYNILYMVLEMTIDAYGCLHWLQSLKNQVKANYLLGKIKIFIGFLRRCSICAKNQHPWYETRQLVHLHHLNLFNEAKLYKDSPRNKTSVNVGQRNRTKICLMSLTKRNNVMEAWGPYPTSNKASTFHQISQTQQITLSIIWLPARSAR